MMPHPMRILHILIALLFSNLVSAQFIKEKAINAQLGYGISVPYNSLDDISDTGFFAQGELVLSAASWVEFRPYAGILITNSDGRDIDGTPTAELAESKAFLIGGKARIRAPIRWVAPYIEAGIGASIGKFETQTFFDSIERSGLIYHLPVSFGLELGRNNNFDLGFMYFFQPTVQQFAGAFTIGVTFPLNN